MLKKISDEHILSFTGNQLVDRINTLVEKTEIDKAKGYYQARLILEGYCLFIDFSLAVMSKEISDEERELFRQYLLEEKLELLQDLFAGYSKHSI